MMNNEKLFKELADKYVGEQGALLLNERAALEQTEDDAPALMTRIKKRRREETLRKVSYAVMPLAACLVIALVYFVPRQSGGSKSADNDAVSNVVNNTTNNTTSNAASEAAEADLPRPEIAYLSAKLPTGYTLTKTDYDIGETIYHIADETGGEIVLSAKHSTAAVTNAVVVYDDYCVFTTQKDGVTYTLTSENDYAALIKLSKII